MMTSAVVLALPPVTRLRGAGVRAAAPAIGIVVLVACAWSSTLVLRGARVAPSEHAAELASLRPLVEGSPTLYMGENDYIPWRLRGAKVAFPYINLGRSQVELVERPEKPWNREQGFDFDDGDQAALDRFRFVVAPRTPYASAAPANWRRVRVTRSYVLWERHGATPPRSVLPESGAPGAMLDCSSPLARSAGMAGVRAVPVVVAPSRLRQPGGRHLGQGQFGRRQIEAGDTAHVRVQLPAGRWTVSLQYTSPVPIEVRADDGPVISVPPALEGPGAFFRVGSIASHGGATALQIHARSAPVLAEFRAVLLGSLAFTRAGDHDRIVPLRAACGRYVDWYRAG
jgi:hypothetical protein